MHLQKSASYNFSGTIKKKQNKKPQGILKQNPYFQGLTLISSVRRTKHVYRRLVPLIDVQVISIK